MELEDINERVGADVEKSQERGCVVYGAYKFELEVHGVHVMT